MSSNPPDPTKHEGYDNDVAEARHTVMEWLGNCFPIQHIAVSFADRSPLALGYFVMAAIHGVREDDFTQVEMATMRGETWRDRLAKNLLALIEHHVDGGGTPEALVLSGPQVDNNTAPYRQTVADSIARRDLTRIDWHKLAEDMSDEPPTWAGYTEEHDTRGCFGCLGPGCMVGYEDELTDDGEEEDQPDPVAMGRLARRALGREESAPE
jgi:hypothetical protein